jgi:hypothetical protein
MSVSPPGADIRELGYAMCRILLASSDIGCGQKRALQIGGRDGLAAGIDFNDRHIPFRAPGAERRIALAANGRLSRPEGALGQRWT